MYPPAPLLGISDMAIDRPTLLNSPHPIQTTTTTTTATCNAQPKSPTAIEAQICNYIQSFMPTTTAPRPATPCSSTAVALRGSGHETTTTAGQSTVPVAPPSLPRVMCATWTTQMVTQLVQLRNQGLSWSRISTHFSGKSGNACRKRYERYRRRTPGRMSVIVASDGRGTQLNLWPPTFLSLGMHETTTPRAFTR